MPKALIRDTEKLLFILDHLLEETEDINKALRSCLNRITKTLGLRRLSLMLLEEEKGELFVKEAFGSKLEIRKDARLKLGEGIAGWVAKEKKPVFVRNILKHPLFRKSKKASGFQGTSFMSVPVQTPRRFYGVLNGAEKEEGKTITEKDFRTFQMLANTLAFFLENQGLFREIKESEKTRLDEMTNLFHEIRIPLTCFQEAVAILKDELAGPLNAQQKQYVEVAERNIQRLKEFIDIFIRWTQKTTTEHLLKLERRRINLVRCGEEIIQNFRPRAEKKKIGLRFEWDSPEIEIWCDPGRLEEVVFNFMDNAIKYSKAGREVVLKVSRSGDRVRVAVEDQGEGIPEEEKKRVFDRFYRLKKAREGGREGHGLGLALCKEIVEAHQGTIGVDSRKGGGSVFWFELPVDVRANRKEVETASGRREA